MYILDTSDAILIYYLVVAKIIPALVTLLADKLFKIKIKFKSLSVFGASVSNISIKWKNYEIIVGEIALRSKYISGEYKKPLCIDIEDVKINHTYTGSAEQRPLEKAHNDGTNEDKNNLSKIKALQRSILRYIMLYLPPTAMILMKFLQVCVKNLSTTVVNRHNGPMLSVSVPNLELLFDGCVVKQRRALFISLVLQHIKSKFIAYNKQNPSCKPPQACLGEVTFDLSLETKVVWYERHLIYEKQHVSMRNTQVTFYGGLFDIIEHVMRHTQKEALSESTELSSELKPSPLPKELIASLTPDILSVSIEASEIKSLTKESSYHYHLLLYQVYLKAKFNTVNTVKVKVNNLRIHTPIHEVLHVKELTSNVKVDENIIKITQNLDTVEAVYNHDDIYGWFHKIFTRGMKSDRRELIIRAFHTIHEKIIDFYHSTIVKDFFAHFIVNISTEICRLVIAFELDDQISSLSATRLKHIIKQSDKLHDTSYTNYTMDLLFKNRNWTVDLICDGPLCWYMGNNFSLFKNDSKGTFVRGSAVFLDNALVRLCSHRDAFKLNLRVNKLHTEYSSKFTKFSLQCVKCCRAFDELFKPLKKKRDDVVQLSEKIPFNMEQFLNTFIIQIKASDLALFFINRHDVCIFVNLVEFTSNDNLNYQFDSLRVSTVDFGKYDSACDLAENSTTYISTKLLKVSLEVGEQSQLCVDFAEKLDCSWNAHFIRHLLSLIRDFRTFKAHIHDALDIPRDEIKFQLPRSLPVGFDIKKLRNIRIKHADVNVDKLFVLINELSSENLFFYNYFH